MRLHPKNGSQAFSRPPADKHGARDAGAHRVAMGAGINYSLSSSWPIAIGSSASSGVTTGFAVGVYQNGDAATAVMLEDISQVVHPGLRVDNNLANVGYSLGVDLDETIVCHGCSFL